jgi:Glycosyl hydrolase family 10
VDATGRFTLARAENESGYLCVPWPTAAGEVRVVSSATLRLTDAPYTTLLELARGAVNRVRSVVAALTSAGLTLPTGLSDDVTRITRDFGKMVAEVESGTAFACRVIDTAATVADRCTASLTEYRLNARKQTHGPLPTRLGCRLSRPLSPRETDLYTDAFNAVRIVPDWRAIEGNEAVFDWSTIDPLVEWATAADLDVSVGPLVDLADGRFPDWMAGWHGDLPNLAAFLTDFLATVMSRYRDRVRTWHVFAGFNHSDVLGLVEDDRLRLAARILETAQELDPKADRVISLSQPWGDYLTSEEMTYSPLVFADTLLRAGLRATTIEMELIGGSGRRGGERRDTLDAIHLFELIDSLGLPLEVVTSGPGVDMLTTAVAAPSVRAAHRVGRGPGVPVRRPHARGGHRRGEHVYPRPGRDHFER